MGSIYSEQDIQELCEVINCEFIKREFNSKSKRSYVHIKCNKHYYKGIQVIEQPRLQRWAKAGRCMCDLWNRDTEDLKRDDKLNQNVEIIGEYKKSNIKIECRCKICGYEWSATPNKLQQGRGCPKCKWVTLHEKNKKPTDKFIKDLHIVQPNLEIIGEYFNAKALIKYRCTVCGYIGESYPTHLLDLTASCRRCRSTVGERLIDKWLDNNKIKYYSQYSFPDCKSKNPLRFDFYLPNNNICIEYQGEQHYKPVCFRKDQKQDIEKDFNSLQERDQIKRNYCRDNGITLIEIPYWEINNINDILNKRII